MINIRTIRKLTNNDGLTLKKGKIIIYKPVGKLLQKELRRETRARQLTRLKHTTAIVAYGIVKEFTTLTKASA